MPRKTIVKKLAARLPTVMTFNRSTVYNKQYEFVIRGFLLEGTAYKATWKLHEFTFALFRTHKFIHLSYCREFNNKSDKYGTWFEGDDDTVVADALSIIHASGSLDDVVQGCSPAQFLERYSVPNLNDVHPTDAFDLACAAGLCGNLSFAKKGLESARQSRVEYARLNGPYTDHEVFLQTVAHRLEALDQGFDAFKASLQKAAVEAAAVHGFCPPSFNDVPESGVSPLP